MVSSVDICAALSFNVIRRIKSEYINTFRNYLVVVTSSKSLWLWVLVYYVDEIINWYWIRNKTVSTQPQHQPYFTLICAVENRLYMLTYELHAIHDTHINTLQPRALLKKIKDWNIGKPFIPIHSFC